MFNTNKTYRYLSGLLIVFIFLAGVTASPADLVDASCDEPENDQGIAFVLADDCSESLGKTSKSGENFFYNFFIVVVVDKLTTFQLPVINLIHFYQAFTGISLSERGPPAQLPYLN